MRSYSVFGVLVIVLVLPALASAQVADRQPSGITVSGTGEIMADPDIAHVSLGVRTRNIEAAAAARENSERTTAVISALRAAGIAENDIETTRYTVQPVYDYRATPPVLLAYEVSNIVRVRLRNVERIGAIIDTAIAAGANEVQGVSFEIENDAEVRNRALVAAIGNAQAKARTIAEQLNVRLGVVIAVTETSPPIGIPRAQVAFAEARMPETPISPQQISVQANIQITYAIMGA